MAHLVDIFLQPSRVFADLKERPTFLVPLVLLTLATVAMSVGYFLQVDPAWFADQQLLASGREMTTKEADQARAMMPGTTVMAGIAGIGSVIAIAAITALMGVYYLLAGKVTGHPVRFRHGVSLSAWSAMPGLLGIIVALVGVFTMTAQTSMESLMLTNLDPLLVQLPVDNRWNRIAENASLLTPWSLFLVALGWRTWTRSSWLQAVVVAVLPTLLVLGIFVTIALLR